MPSGAGALPSVAFEQGRLFGHKQQREKKGKSKAKRNSTCTLKFVCLASKEASGPPSSVKGRTSLANSGLGDHSITFESQDTVYNGILENYPLLADAGG